MLGTLARVLDGSGLRVPGMEYGGTQTHQVHVHHRHGGFSHKIANELLPSAASARTRCSFPGPAANSVFGWARRL